MTYGDSDAEDRLRRRFTRRTLLLGLGQAGLFGVLGTRLYKLQITQGENYASLADQNRLSVRPIAPVRGRIFDTTGRVLADNRDVLGISIIPDLAGDVEQVLSDLAEIVPLTSAEKERILRRALRQNRVLPIPLDVTLDWRMLARITVNAPALPGVQTETRKQRTYATGTALGQIVGYVGAVEKHRAGQDPALRLPGMRIGKAGIEAALDDQLRGIGGSVKHEVNGRGQIVRKLDEIASEPGEDVKITIDKVLQARIMKRVARYRLASAAVIDVDSGAVLALASAPSFDPNHFVGGISKADWRDLQADPGKPLENRAIRGQYPPGSTFKMVTALAALDAGVITADEKLWCSGAHEYAGDSFGCWKRSGHGRVRLHRALRESCDVYFYQLAERLGIERLAQTARRLGLGEIYQAGIAGQRPGVVPDPAWKLYTLERPWLGGETLLAGIGQGYVLATPLQLAVMTARIATGRMVEPALVERDQSIEGVPAPPPEPLGFDEEALKAVRAGMFAAVNEPGGTGHNGQLPIAGIQIAGKTGTAQVSRRSRTTRHADLDFNLRDHSLFVAFAPADAPRYAVSVVVEHGGGGGKAAAPLASQILTDVFYWAAPQLAERVEETEDEEVPTRRRRRRRRRVTAARTQARRRNRRARRRTRQRRRRRQPSITRLFIE